MQNILMFDERMLDLSELISDVGWRRTGSGFFHGHHLPRRLLCEIGSFSLGGWGS